MTRKDLYILANINGFINVASLPDDLYFSMLDFRDKVAELTEETEKRKQKIIKDCGIDPAKPQPETTQWKRANELFQKLMEEEVALPDFKLTDSQMKPLIPEDMNVNVISQLRKLIVK